MRHVKEKTKLKQKRCQGEGIDYVPWIMAHEQSSVGSSFIAKNYKTGRDVHMLSNSEAKVFFLLLWDDDVLDIKEQYVLDLDETKQIAEDLGYRKPQRHMSTDFFLDINDPVYSHMAISVKMNEKDLEKRRSQELLKIERTYWESKGVWYELIFADNINPILVKNIRLVTKINKPEDIQSDVDALRYLLTHKKISTDMHKEINYQELLKLYKKEVDQLYEIFTRDEKRNWRRKDIRCW